jgi:hypothetical protein
MKKYLWLLLLLPVVFYFIGKDKKKETEAPLTLTNPPAKKYKESRKIFLGRKAITENLTDHEGCLTAATQINEVDFNIPLKEWLETLNDKDFEHCTDPELQERAALIRKHCFGTKINDDDCYTNLLMFRSIIRVRSIKEPSSREELADMIMAEFSKKTPDFKKLKEFSKELLNRDPNDKPVQKIWAMSAVIDADPKNLKPELVNEIYKTLDPEQIDTDPELRGLDVIMKTKLEAGAVEDYTRDLIERNPKDMSSREMLGWSLWQQGRRDEAIAQIDTILASKKDPYLVLLRKRKRVIPED